MAKTRTFDGLYYDLIKSTTKKHDADHSAKRARAAGYNVRVIKTKNASMTKYDVYKSRRHKKDHDPYTM